MKKIAIVLILMVISATSYGQDGWVWQNPLPQGNALEGVYFTDASNGWSVGDNGTIMHTTDGGNNWTPKHLEAPTTFIASNL